jgi:hypothetical protein
LRVEVYKELNHWPVLPRPSLAGFHLPADSNVRLDVARVVMAARIAERRALFFQEYNRVNGGHKKIVTAHGLKVSKKREFCMIMSKTVHNQNGLAGDGTPRSIFQRKALFPPRGRLRRFLMQYSLRDFTLGWTLFLGLVAGSINADAHPRPAVIVGAYYFDGWNHQTAYYHLTKLLTTRFAYRKPIWGWYDNTEAIMREQINLCADHDIAFWAFDWYYKTVANNNALHLYLKASNHNRLKFCLNICSSITPTEWKNCSRRLLVYFKQPTYLRQHGQPLLIVYDPGRLLRSFGGVAAMRSAFGRLQAKAEKAGIHGIQIAACTGPGHLNRFVRAGYTLLTSYNYRPTFNVLHSKPEPYSALMAYSRKIFDKFVGAPLPYIPVITTGWDWRPWNLHHRPSTWFIRTPRDVERFVRMGVRWIYHYYYNKGPARHLLLLYAWNENGEGGWLTPTAIRGDAYLDAVQRAVAAPPNEAVGGSPAYYGRAGARPPAKSAN